MTARCCCNCAFAASVEIEGRSVLVCANRPDGAGCLVCVAPEGTCRRFAKARPTRGRRREADAPESVDERVRHIPLTKGRFAIVDAADYAELSKHCWYWQPGRNGSGYARRGGGGTSTTLMHRQIMQPADGMVVDHIDGNGLNNRRANLRVCTPQENALNRRPSKQRREQGQFKGVCFPAGQSKPRSSIHYNGKDIYLGTFETEIEAAKAYDLKALELFGQFAYLNFPHECDGPDRDTVV